MNRLIFLSFISLGILCYSASFAKEEAVKLQTSGVFKKNEKGVLILLMTRTRRNTMASTKALRKKSETWSEKKSILSQE